MKIITNRFATRHTLESPFSHYIGSWEGLEKLVTQVITEKPELLKPGYRDGVKVLSLPTECAELFHSGIRRIQDGDALIAFFEPRALGEEKAINVLVTGNKQVAKKVEIVLYSQATLAEDGDATPDVVADWEIISINAQPDLEEVPMTPLAMARNMLHKKGGTKAEYTAEQFAQAIWYWSQHANVMRKS